MAVVQISKIQHRRGQKNSNSGIPQLSSAEFAWAVDTQELFIGNGSVAEGAPYVGNTKVLTEHDNILELANSYKFGGELLVNSVPRPLQSKLDEYVSVKDFGAVGDGVADNVAAFEAAFTALFKNVDTSYRKVLIVPNGIYNFSRDIAIPAGQLTSNDPDDIIRNVIIRGETQLGSVLNIGANNIRFITVDNKEFTEFESTNRPANVVLSNLTIKRTTGQLVLSGVADSVIDSVKFQGEFELGDAVDSLSTEEAAVFWINDLAGRKVDNIKFVSCTFEANSIAIKCSQTDLFDTEVDFKDCDFFVGDTAIYLEGLQTQRNNWTIEDCRFEEVSRHAVRMTQGQGTLILRSRFKNCGNGTNTADTPLEYIVFFGEKLDNILIDCISDRQQSAGIVTSNDVAAVPEVYNADKVTFVNRNHSEIFLSNSFRPLAVFSAFNRFITVNYFLQLGSYSRVGKLTITVGDDLSEVQTTDEFQYASPLAVSVGGQIMTNFEFDAELRSNDTIIRADAPDDSALTPDTVVLTYKNPILTGALGSISFDVTYGV
jgi:hypothetical protein